jgi:hypothetical protein
MAPPKKTAPTHRTDKVLSRRILVEISHSVDTMSKMPKAIWAHEFPIFEEIWGEGNVKTIDPSTMDEGFKAKMSPADLAHNKVQDLSRRPSETAGLGYAFYGDARAEYDRLALAYGMHPEVKMPVVEKIYGRFSTGLFERALGIAEFEDMPDGQLREIVTSYGYLPQLRHDSTKEERREAGEAYSKLNTMPREELLKLTEDLVAEYA